ncbi:hypothetical protein N7534_009322 [Penicillium rubens]|nr:hypothetical protein N7534_009322 [Penicillium rubens]
MTSSNTPKKAPVKRGRPATGFDKNHEFLLHCLTQSGVRIDHAAVGKCEGISEKQARRRFYWLKSQISSHENDATPGAGSEAEKQGQGDNQDGNDAKENI